MKYSAPNCSLCLVVDAQTHSQAQLLLAAFRITARVLRRGGAFVAKIFRGRDIDLLFAQVR